MVARAYWVQISRQAENSYTYYNSVKVLGSATSLIVKGSTAAMLDIHSLTCNDGATIHPSGAPFNGYALAATSWVHITATGLPIDATNFPDEAFRSIVDQRYDIHDDDYLSRYERSLVTTMNVYQQTSP